MRHALQNGAHFGITVSSGSSPRSSAALPCASSRATSDAVIVLVAMPAMVTGGGACQPHPLAITKATMAAIVETTSAAPAGSSRQRRGERGGRSVARLTLHPESPEAPWAESR